MLWLGCIMAHTWWQACYRQAWEVSAVVERAKHPVDYHPSLQVLLMHCCSTDSLL